MTVSFGSHETESKAQADFLSRLPTQYVWNTEREVNNTENKIISVVEWIFNAIYQPIHRLAGKLIVLASWIHSAQRIAEYRKRQQPGWEYKRVTVEVDGLQIDGMIVRKEATLNNGRWVLVSPGNGEFYEAAMAVGFSHIPNILNEVQGNGLLFNYPGVGASSGSPTRQSLTKAYRAMLAFLEDQEKGIGAKEIIGYGHSLGGGVQNDALEMHSLKKEISYVFVKSRTFSSLSSLVNSILFRPLGFLVNILGWNMQPAKISKSLQAPEIIMQTARVSLAGEILNDSSKIVADDDVITKADSLAEVLLNEIDDGMRKRKAFIGIREKHNEGLRDPTLLGIQINEFLKKEYQAY